MAGLAFLGFAFLQNKISGLILKNNNSKKQRVVKLNGYNHAVVCMQIAVYQRATIQTKS